MDISEVAWTDEGKDEIYVTSYPRSGNTWLNKLLCDLLRSPLKDTPEMAPAWFGPHRDGEHVIRKVHRVGTDKLDRGKWVLIQRDPRDVVVSAMYYNGGTSLWSFLAWNLCRCSGDDPTMGVYETWLRSWLDHPDTLDAITKYELLHTDPINELRRVVHALTGISLEDAWIKECYERQNFAKVKAAAKGKLDRPMHKGVAGAWKSHFTRAEAAFFHDSLGDFMLEQGYITTDRWRWDLPRTSNHCSCVGQD
jgi:hypothetical protein